MTKTNYSAATMKIHNAVNAEAEQLILSINSNAFQHNAEMEDLIEAGFYNVAGVQDYCDAAEQVEMNAAYKKVAQRFAGYKTLQQQELYQICDQYQLKWDDLHKYIGEIPKSNLQKVLAFKKRFPNVELQIAAPHSMFLKSDAGEGDDPIVFGRIHIPNFDNIVVIVTMWGKEQTIPDLQNPRHN